MVGWDRPLADPLAGLAEVHALLSEADRAADFVARAVAASANYLTMLARVVIGN